MTYTEKNAKFCAKIQIKSALHQTFKISSITSAMCNWNNGKKNNVTTTQI